MREAVNSKGERASFGWLVNAAMVAVFLVMCALAMCETGGRLTFWTILYWLLAALVLMIDGLLVSTWFGAKGSSSRHFARDTPRQSDQEYRGKNV